MKTTLQTTSNRQGIPLENYSFTLVTRFIFWNNTPGRNAFMRKIYLLLIISIFSSAIIAQSFVEITGTPFDGISSNATSFSDIDNDNDQDVLIGSKLYTNDGTGLYEGPIWTPFIELLGGAVAFADIDNDSDQDVIITGGIFDGGWETHMSFYTKLYTNNGSGLFLEVASSSFIGLPPQLTISISQLIMSDRIAHIDDSVTFSRIILDYKKRGLKSPLSKFRIIFGANIIYFCI